MPISFTGRSYRMPIPEPFNANDVTIWTDLICKFICHSMNTPFDTRNFLQEVIDDKMRPLNAYDKEMLKSASRGVKNEFYSIIMYCVELLEKNRLLTSQTYVATNRLKAICPIVDRYLMPGIKSVLDAEREIRNNPSLLKSLKNLRNRIAHGDYVVKLTTTGGLPKLTQLGIIILYIDGRVEVTPLGKIILSLLESENPKLSR